MNIHSTKAIEVMDSRGKPTVRAFITLSDGSVHQASVPSGASTGSHEATELRDDVKGRHHGMGVQKAVEHINTTISEALKGQSIAEPKEIDTKMCTIDGTTNKASLGANAILAVSEAVTRAAAHAENTSLWQYINTYYFSGNTVQFPRLMCNVVNGGKHAGWNFDIQEFMIIPRTNKPHESVRIAAEIFQQLGKNLKKQHLSTLVGDEGGYSPTLSSNEEVFETIIAAAEDCGYAHGADKDFEFAIDAAASEFYEDDMYVMKKTGDTMTGNDLLLYYERLQKQFAIASLEDPFAEDDWENFQMITDHAKDRYHVVGDDLLTTNPKRISKAIENNAANAVLIKLNQIGTVKETIEAIRLAQKAEWAVAVSHRSGDTEDPFIADLAYAAGADFIKTGSMSRSERLAKYNRLLEIEAGM